MPPSFVEVGGHDSWVMYGPVFFSRTFSEKFLPLLERYYHTPGTEQFYWENVLMEHLDELEIDINRQPENQIYEFELKWSIPSISTTITFPTAALSWM